MQHYQSVLLQISALVHSLPEIIFTIDTCCFFLLVKSGAKNKKKKGKSACPSVLQKKPFHVRADRW